MRSPSRRSALRFLAHALCLVSFAARAALGQEVSTDWLNEDRGSRVTDEGPRARFGQEALLYPSNRLLDLLDVLHVDLGFGFGLHVNVHATRMAQVGAGLAAPSKLGIDGRRVGFFNEKRSELSILPFSVESFSRDGVLGTFDDYDTGSRREQLYEDVRDYYELGGAASAGVVSVAADVRPMAIVDFLAGWAGFDPQGDDHPIGFERNKTFRFGVAERRAIGRLVFVTSRVVSSPRVGSEAASGVAVYHHRSNGEFYWGRLGRWRGAGADADEEAELNAGLTALGYDVVDDLADRFETAYRRNASRTEIVPASTFKPFADRRVEKKVADEIVLRLPNYRGLAEAYGADAVLDLRLLEWSVFQHRPGQGLRIRLNVECKIIKYPENEVLVDVSEIIYDIEKKSETEMSEFAANSARLVRIETQQALDILVPKFIDRLFER